MTEEERMTLTVEQTAKVLGLSRNNVYGLVAEGKIPSLRLGKRLLVPKKSLQLLLDGDSYGQAVAKAVKK